MQRISVISLMYSVTYLGIFIAESSCCKREKNMNLTSLEESHYSMMKEVKPENWYVHSTDLAVNCKNSLREITNALVAVFIILIGQVKRS